MKKKIFLVFGFAFLIRLFFLNQSLWLDEAITAKVVRQFSLFQIPNLFSPTDFHPPLYYIFLKLWTTLFGTSEIALRMPSVIFSLLTGHAVYLIGSRLRNSRFGLWAAALYLFNPLGVYYSQEARMYSLVTFLLSFATYFLIELLFIHEKEKKTSFFQNIRTLITLVTNPEKDRMETLNKMRSKSILLFLFELMIVFSLWTFYGSLFFIAGLLIYLAVKRQYRYAGITIAVISISVFFQYPLFKMQLENSKTLLYETPLWTHVLGQVNVKNLFLIPIKFSVGRLSFYPKFLYYLIAGVWTLFVFSFVLLGGIKKKGLFMIFIIPVIFGFIASFFTPMLQYFRFLYLLPIMTILIAEGAESYVEQKKKKGFLLLRLFQKKKKTVLQTIRENAIFEILLVFFVMLSLVYLFAPSMHREDWKSLAKEIPEGKTVYMILPSSDPLLYYKKIPLKELRTVQNEWLFEKNMYVIPYTSLIYGFDYEKALNNKGCYRKEKRVFHEVYFEIWTCGYVS